MILSNVNIGTGPSTGDGDPLRVAFNKINNDFAILASNVAQLSNSVTSVAGRTGNVILTTQDIVGINNYASSTAITAANVGMRGYVDAKITANIALLVNAAPTTLDTIRELADAIGDDPNFAVNVALSVSSANTKMRGYVDGQILAANAGVTAANLGMKGYVDSVVGGSSNYSNVNAVSLITSLGLTNYSNVNVKAYTESMGFQNFGNANVAAYLTTNNYATKSTVANLTNGIYTVSLDTIGNVTLPGGATIGRTVSNTAIFTASTGGVLEIKSSANNNKLQVDDTMVSVMAGDSHWHFDDNGKLTLPSGANITSYGAGVTTILDDNGVVIAQQVGSNAFSVTTATGVRVLASGQIWTFNGNGSLSFPGGQIQTTAFNNTAPIITTLIANAATQSDLIIGINANVNQANLGMKGYVDSVASQSIYGNSNVKSYLTGGFDGNIIPSANVTYSLGNVTHRWRDLYLSGNTIFLGDATITTESGRLVTTGAAISPPTGAVGFANVQFEAPTDFAQIRSYYVDNNFGYTANLKSWTTAPIVWDNLRSAKLKINSNSVTGYTSDFASLDTSGGRFANAVCTLDTTGNIASITITDGGVGYDSYYPYYVTDPTGYNSNYIGQSYTGSPTGATFRRIDLIPTTASDLGNVAYLIRGYSGGPDITRGPAAPTVGSNTYTWTGNSGSTFSITIDWTANTSTSWSYTPALPALTSAQEWQDWLLDYQSTNDYGWLIASGSGGSVGGYQAVYDYLNREALPNILTYDIDNAIWYVNNNIINNAGTTATISDNKFSVEFGRTAIGYTTVENSYGNPVYWSRGLSADTGISSGGDMTVAGDLRVTGDLYVSPTSIYMGDLQISAADGNLKVNTGFKFSDNTVQTTAYTGSTYGNVQVATYLPTYTGNVQAGNVKVTSAYRFATGAVTITNGDSHVELTPDTGANALAGVKIGGGGYLLGPNNSRCITLNFGSVGGAVGLQSNVTIGTGGSGNLVVNGSLTIRGNIINGNVAGFSIGYRDVPQVSAGNVTLGLTDAGKHYYATASAPTTLTIPSNANVAFPVGTAITVVNAGTGTITVGKETEASLYLAGNSTNSTRTLSSYGMATLLKTAADQWFINGTGLA